MARKKNTQRKPKVVLVDVNCVLWVWDKAPHSKNWSISDTKGNKFKTGGLSGLINVMRRVDYNINTDIFVFAFDRPSFRKNKARDLGIPYKDGREKMSASLKVQSDLAFEYLNKMGFNAIAIDGLEADDIIYSIAKHAKEFGIAVDIISTDRDYCILIDEKTQVVSPSTKVPTVTHENYEWTIGASKGHFIKYNSIALYKALCGDDSDKIPSVCKQPYAMYRKIINKLEAQGFDFTSLTDYAKVEEILQQLESPVKEKAIDNLELVKMVMLEAERVPMKRSVINVEAVLEFATIINSKNLAKKFGLEITEFPEYVTKTRSFLTSKVMEMEASSAYQISEPDALEPSDAVQAITDIELEEKFYVNVGVSTQTSNTEETKLNNPDKIESSISDNPLD